MKKDIFRNLEGGRLKDFKKATKKDLEQIEDVYLYGVRGGCTFYDLYIEFEKVNNLEIEFVEDDWVCCSNKKRYKIDSDSYIFKYDGFLRF